MLASVLKKQILCVFNLSMFTFLTTLFPVCLSSFSAFKKRSNDLIKHRSLSLLYLLAGCTVLYALQCVTLDKPLPWLLSKGICLNNKS